ncbi:MAG TPA: bifunctional hydroxymethylpyrimidine kinase/phosphomethylpyrimidine kinase [Mycobacteriales bacterium]|nr:bifunctional hydroxymethylpyrimidine kinase/phosphomethylpyrimidine kinase [Mycobacteriales bacterium]
MRTVLAVGGSDSGGGAGVQADIKALHAVGVHACTAVTAVTAQDTAAVRGIWPVPTEVLRAQLQAVLDDIGADVVKTGMLPSAAAVAAVADAIGELPLVVDPVGVSSTGQQLASREALDALRVLLLPQALLVTPNLAEVAALTGVAVEGAEDLEEAALAVLALGPRWVLVTGGHLPGDPVDLLHDGTTALVLHGRRVPTPHTHGTGCTLAAALAGHLALGADVPTAARRAKALVTGALERGYPLGRGPGPVSALPTSPV